MKRTVLLAFFLIVFVFAQESIDQQKTNLEQTKNQPKEPSKKKSMEESLARKKRFRVFLRYTKMKKVESFTCSLKMINLKKNTFILYTD